MINMPGGPEIAVILILALIVLGPQQLPKAMRTFGNAMAEIRKVSNGFQAEMRSAMDAIETQANETISSSSLPPSGADRPVPDPNAPTPDAGDSTDDPDRLLPDPGYTEVVARNAEPAAVEPADEDGPPAIDPADRAAG